MKDTRTQVRGGRPPCEPSVPTLFITCETRECPVGTTSLLFSSPAQSSAHLQYTDLGELMDSICHFHFLCNHFLTPQAELLAIWPQKLHKMNFVAIPLCIYHFTHHIKK